MGSSKPTLPIAEVFTSVHGEGAWAGTPMTFIRLAGCTVGKYPINNKQGPLTLLPNNSVAAICTTFDGRQFPCDTEFHKTSDQNIDELLTQIPSHIKHVCITGGEPLMHLERILKIGLVEILVEDRGVVVHFETSGTILPPAGWVYYSIDGVIYFACSPKFNYQMEFIEQWANEIRLMVDKDFDQTAAKSIYDQRSDAQVYLAPISKADDTTDFDPQSLQKCMELLEVFPAAKISIQMHKVLHVR